MWKYVRYHFRLVAWKRQKLKLGAIVFEIKEIVFAEVILHEEPEIRFIRQDTSEEDSLKIENRLEAIKWRWDFKNIGAFILVAWLVFLYIRASLILWYQDKFPTLAFRDESILELIRFTLTTALASCDVASPRIFSFLNYLMVDTLTEICSIFNFLM